ncbi:MAG TPA: GIY-YIG nuclease family protein [Pyrinomonadaceae bacterium]|jgi:hypothetical protein
MQQFSIVYVLSNPAMPGLVKIGRTSHDDANIRIAQLYTTGVPVPFTIEFAGRIPNSEEVEKALHTAFAPYRVNPKREFFRIEPEQAIAILKLLHTEDATAEILQQPNTLDQQSVAAAEHLKSRRPNLNFEEMGIPIGSNLQSIHTDTVVEVIAAKKVRLGDEEMSLTAATRRIYGIEHDIAPSPHWAYQGRPLKEIYDETYGNLE